MIPPFTVTLQTAFDRAVGQLQLWNQALCCPLVSFLQFQGSVIGLLLTCGWLWAGIMRNRELRRQRRLHHVRLSKPYTGPLSGLTALSASTGKDRPPGVTIVLPVKGCGTHSQCNWQSQLKMLCDGPVEFLFVVDSKADPAFAAVQRLIAQPIVPRHVARIIVAPMATTHSQKIGNLIAGIKAASPEHKYVLCLDDDVTMHPHSLQLLVQALEADKSAFMATGYPLDIPPPGSSLLAYCALAYHLPLLIAFSTRQVTSFVWGGCMLLPLASLRSDSHGILKAWQEGGYSDDLIVASVCGERGLSILCPSAAIFPQWLDGSMRWRRYWNYLRRQLYVMDTYSSPHNRVVNHTMMVLHTYLSLAFVAPCATVAVRLCVWGSQMALLPTQKVWDGPGTSMQWVSMFGAGACPINTLSLALFLGSFALAGCALVWMVAVACSLFQELSPAPQSPYAADMFNWAKVWLAFLLSNAILPGCMLYTALCPTVEWSGVRYCKRRGRVSRADLPLDML